MTDNLRRAIGSIVRTLLVLAAGVLIRHKIGSSALFTPAIDDLVGPISGWLILTGTAGWSLWQKSRFAQKLATALVMPPAVNGVPTTEADVDKVVKASTAPGTQSIVAILSGTPPVPTPATAAAFLAAPVSPAGKVGAP
jgi:hypothetical protein